MWIEHPDEHIEILFVVRDLELGLERGIDVHLWLEHAEVREAWRILPHGVVTSAVDARGPLGAQRSRQRRQ
jgi:hypothetical protein